MSLQLNVTHKGIGKRRNFWSPVRQKRDTANLTWDTGSPNCYKSNLPEDCNIFDPTSWVFQKLFRPEENDFLQALFSRKLGRSKHQKEVLKVTRNLQINQKSRDVSKQEASDTDSPLISPEEQEVCDTLHYRISKLTWRRINQVKKERFIIPTAIRKLRKKFHITREQRENKYDKGPTDDAEKFYKKKLSYR